jgi:transcriptional regulator with XRE-family HTH domain
MGEAEASGNVFAERLDRLLARSPRQGGGRYTLREVADGVNRLAGERLISDTYLSQLRTGQRTNPGYRRLEGIAKFFGVDVQYFFDAEVASHTDAELDLLAQMSDAGVRDLAARASGLSEPALAAVRALIDHFRVNEGLPAVGDTSAEDPAPDSGQLSHSSPA